MSEHARNVAAPHDSVSKIVKRRCKEVTDFIEQDNDIDEDGSHSEECDTTSEEDVDSDMQSVLDQLEVREAKPNKTFSGDKLREIERRNAMLMNKLIKNSQRRNQYGCATYPSKETSAAINRRRQQEKINRDNLVI